ncbi:MAG: creatininase family protein [Gudongella sp.]|nr:creatininase family protein [Gudongella sp.]
MNGKNLQLRYMTWPEIKEKKENGYDTIIISLGAMEQHGLHLPECTDETIGTGLACGLAERIGKTLVAPTIIPGLSAHHMSLPGSLTLRPHIFKGVVEDYISSYIHHGFKKFIFLASHGGNMDTTKELIEEFKSTYEDAYFYNALTLDKLMTILMKYEKEYGMAPGSCGGHACAFETSLMLYLAPKLVKMDKAKAGYVGLPTREIVEKMFNSGVVGISEIGVLGDPTLATAELGEKFYNAAIDEMEHNLKEQV